MTIPNPPQQHAVWTRCDCDDFGSRDVTVQIFAGDVNITHVHCGKPVHLDHEYLMSGVMPMTLTYSMDEDAEESYQVLSPATGESVE
jgi:hypothetical protein